MSPPAAAEGGLATLPAAFTPSSDYIHFLLSFSGYYSCCFFLSFLQPSFFFNSAFTPLSDILQSCSPTSFVFYYHCFLSSLLLSCSSFRPFVSSTTYRFPSPLRLGFTSPSFLLHSLFLIPLLLYCFLLFFHSSLTSLPFTFTYSSHSFYRYSCLLHLLRPQLLSFLSSFILLQLLSSSFILVFHSRLLFFISVSFIIAILDPYIFFSCYYSLCLVTAFSSNSFSSLH